ncbi:hypothetical protein CANCADRAFT_31321 [Tortispora caseinolytica NRRL Y-17796]|uniref:Uncharacterized protein n=1 Tax=Tortispora caseinolytica NRRL Y-17796 TaxID=767744 RepID=A0A1E4TEX1_9ASCO|nr:hypothetical protein CANCADRAFT_31321 [Tortispora caseinolytica NRRL Y-17796]
MVQHKIKTPDRKIYEQKTQGSASFLGICRMIADVSRVGANVRIGVGGGRSQ